MSIGISSSYSEPGWEELGNTRYIRKLEEALRACRHSCAFNLHSPGNENDTLEYVVSVVGDVLQDDYEYVPEDGE